MVSAPAAAGQAALRAGPRYRRVVVPICGAVDCRAAMDTACALAAEHRAAITAVYVIEVSPLLPLDARMDVDVRRAQSELRRAETVADSYPLRFRGRTVRARDAGRAILDVADAECADLIVLAAPRRRRAYGTRWRFGATVKHVLVKASCRVLVVSPPDA